MPDRIEREIEEILDKIDRFVPSESAPLRFRRRSAGVFGGIRKAFLSPVLRVSVAQIMLLGIGLFILSFFIGRYDGTLGKWTAVVGAILFLGGFVLSFVAGHGRQQPKRWRGRVVEYDEPDLGERIRMWFRARRGPRRPPPR